jgi:hypothetical protein
MRKVRVTRLLSALVIAGVAATSAQTLASADTVATQVSGAVGATDVQLYNDSSSPSGPIELTAKSDGTDTTVRLEAGGGINVAKVTFQVSRNGGSFADVATVSRNDDGAFSTEWTPADYGAFPGDTVDLRVVNTADPAETDSESGFILRNGNAINIAAGSQKGYFEDPDAPTQYTLGVTGTTSVTSTNAADRPCISWQDGGGTGVDVTCDTSNLGNGTFEGVLRFSDVRYNLDDPALPPVEADQMVVRAQTDTVLEPDEQTDDFETFTLYEQTLTSLTATAGTVTALDENCEPIAGIDVYTDSGALVGESDGRGQVRVAQSAVQYYYANADASDGFSPAAGDKRTGGFACAEAVKPAILLVHGINAFKAQVRWKSGVDCNDYWEALPGYLKRHGFDRKPIVKIGYYEADTNCANIKGSWHPVTQNSYMNGTDAHANNLGHTKEAAIEHLGYHLAWYIYNNYSKYGVAVDVVAHSMGGLMIRFALGKVEAQHPDFPPLLIVKNAVTLGTPHGGARAKLFASGCDGRQCSQMRPGDGFLKSLEREAWNPQGRGGTDWTAIGSDDDQWVAGDRAAGTSRNRDKDAYFGACHKLTYPWHEHVMHGDYMKDVPKGNPQYASFITRSDRCGAPLNLKERNQLTPVEAIARALKSGRY